MMSFLLEIKVKAVKSESCKNTNFMIIILSVKHSCTVVATKWPAKRKMHV